MQLYIFIYLLFIAFCKNFNKSSNIVDFNRIYHLKFNKFNYFYSFIKIIYPFKYIVK